VEETLCGIWEAVLKRDLIGADDHFFDLGGHSLLATQVVSRVKEALSVELPLARFFQTPVLSELAQFVEQHLRPGEGAEPPLQPISREQPLPLSFAQQRLWFLDQLEPANPLYNTPGALRLLGQLDIAALEQALSEIVRRHETLRTTFQSVDGNPVQIISAPCPVNIPLIDLSALVEVDREREVQRLIDTEAKCPFDLSRGPLLRATLLRLREEEHLLLFTMHHMRAKPQNSTRLSSEMRWTRRQRFLCNTLTMRCGSASGCAERCSRRSLTTGASSSRACLRCSNYRWTIRGQKCGACAAPSYLWNSTKI
jgi:acyl carrier protein